MAIQAQSPPASWTEGHIIPAYFASCPLSLIHFPACKAPGPHLGQARQAASSLGPKQNDSFCD